MIVDDGWAGRIMTWLRAASALIVVNLLVIVGTALGLVVLGALPAAAAATVCLTRLRDGEGTAGLVRLFAREYRSRFLRAHALGLPFAGIIALAAADTAVLPLLPPAVGAALAVVTWIAVAYAVIGLVGALAIDVRYRDSIAATLRYAAGLPLTSPVMSLLLVVSLAAVAAALLTIPALLPLIGASVPLFVAGWFIDHRLAQIDPAHPRAAALAH